MLISDLQPVISGKAYKISTSVGSLAYHWIIFYNGHSERVVNIGPIFATSKYFSSCSLPKVFVDMVPSDNRIYRKWRY